MADKKIECATHGDSRAAYVCTHTMTSLRDQHARGFFWCRDDDGCVNAWCDSCDNVLEQCGGSWNDESESHAQITLVCEECAQRAATLNGFDITR